MIWENMLSGNTRGGNNVAGRFEENKFHTSLREVREKKLLVLLAEVRKRYCSLSEVYCFKNVDFAKGFLAILYSNKGASVFLMPLAFMQV